MKKRLLHGLILLALVLTSGCGMNEERYVPADETQSPDQITQTSQEESQLLTGDLSDIETAFQYSAKYGLDDINLEVLFTDTHEKIEDEYSDYIRYASDGSEVGGTRDSEGFGFYCTEQGNRLDSWSVRLGDDRTFFSEYEFTDTGFFTDIKTARENILQLLASVGISGSQLDLYPISEEMFDYYCDYYDRNLLMDENDRHARDLYGDYSQFYYGYGRFACGGLPVFDGNAGNIDNGSAVFGSHFTVIYTENGLEALWIQNHYIVDAGFCLKMKFWERPKRSWKITQQTNRQQLPKQSLSICRFRKTAQRICTRISP